MKNISKLEVGKQEFDIDFQAKDMEKIENILIKNYEKENTSKFNDLIFPLMNALSLEKQEDERKNIFESRLLSELNKVLKVDLEWKEETFTEREDYVKETVDVFANDIEKIKN